MTHYAEQSGYNPRQSAFENYAPQITMSRRELSSEEMADLKKYSGRSGDKTVNYNGAPVVNITFGDVHETADVDAVIKRLEQVVEETYDSSLAG